jgi:DNA-3-methyladenine glycosylase
MLPPMRPSDLAKQFPPLSGDFYARDPAEVAPGLLGCVLVRVAREGVVAGRIVETEAYLAAADPACHAFRGRTRRNAVMFGPPGHAYVYAIHARWCLNTVTEPTGVGSAVLIRAVQPLDGAALMRARRTGVRRARGCRTAHALADTDLARGPARLCEAFAIDRALDGWDLTQARRLWIGAPGSEDAGAAQCNAPARSVRIGVTSAHDLPLRFFWPDCPYVSGPRRREG